MFLRRSSFAALTAIAVFAACSSQPKPVTAVRPKVVHDTVTVRDPDLDKRVARLELQVLARDAEIEDLQTMKAGASQDPPEADQVNRLVRQAANAFDKTNYGGALYLANQAKTLALSYRGRIAGSGREAARPGETAFAVPIRLTTTTRGNVRGGPGTNFPIVFAADSGMTLTGYSYADEWIRISDDGGRGGWIFRTLVARP